MNILIINPAIDPASVGLNLWRAINSLTEHEARHISYSHSISYLISGEHDIFYDVMGEDELAEIIMSADILHFNQNDWSYRIPGSNIFEKITNHIDEKHKIVFHGHGGSWLLNPGPQIKHCAEIGASIVVCSPMDPAVVPCAKWLPNVMPLDEFHEPDWNRDFSGGLTIGLSANNSNGVYKGREMVEYMVAYLAREHGFDVAFDFVFGMKLNESLMRRRSHHITIDNWVQGFTGMAGFEGLALGHVVFGRFDPMVREAWEDFAAEMIPIVDIKGFDTCAAKIRDFYNNRDYLIDHCRIGRAWIEKYYNEKSIVDKWIKFYEGL